VFLLWAILSVIGAWFAATRRVRTRDRAVAIV